ncbi:MAG TPA: acyltransferase [Pyrinomonadaceae bacterium]|nr:acyltransferase [Pyrinomonadaceae bacterium]
MPYRKLSAQPEAEAAFEEFLSELYQDLTEGRRDPNEVVRDTLYEIYRGDGTSPIESAAARSLIHSFDPRNITTEPEHYEEIDVRLYAERKPLIWLWQMFDRSPLGQNALLAHRLHRMLAPLIFKRVGANFKCWNFVEWSFGYNLSFGDNVVVHRHVLLDDRGGIEIGDDVSISDYVNIYSHSHDLYDISTVYNQTTRIGNGARLTYHSTVLAGVTVGDQAMIGSGAVVTKDVEPYHVVLGIPARTARVKASEHLETAANSE